MTVKGVFVVESDILGEWDMEKHDTFPLGLICFADLFVLFSKPSYLIGGHTSKTLLTQAIFIARVKDPDSEFNSIVVVTVNRKHIIELMRKPLLIRLCETVLK